MISDIHGVSGRDMLDALAAGQRDPHALAAMARGKMRGKIRRLEEALECSFFTDEHAAVLAMMLQVIDHYTARISQLTATIEELAEPYLPQIEQLDAVPGIGMICAQDIIAEIGTDMAVFPTASHLVSWAKWSPQVRQSAGKRKGSNATGRGNPYLGAALGEAGISAGNTQSFLGARYRKLTRRMPRKKALVATGNSMLTIIHALLSDPARHTPISAPTTTSSACTPAGRHATTSRAWNASATKSPSKPSTRQPASSPRPADHRAKNPETLTRHQVLPRAQPRSIFGPVGRSAVRPRP